MPDPAARKRLLVVLADDHSLVRAGFRSILGDEDDIDVFGEARDGAQAAEAAISQRPDVVLMDIRMPGMDGLEATRRITADPRLRGTVVVLTTGRWRSSGSSPRAGQTTRSRSTSSSAR